MVKINQEAVQQELARAELIQSASLVIIVLLVLFVNLGGKELWEASESRPAQEAREMLLPGTNALLPNLDGATYLKKPPLFAWTVALFYHVTGVESELMARFPTALCALFTVLLLYMWGRRVVGFGWAYTVGIVLVLSYRYLWQARLSELETMLALWTTLSLILFYEGLRSTGKRSVSMILGAHVALGLSVMTKGPVGPLVVLGTIVPYALITRNWRWLLRPAFLLGFLVAGVVAGAWFVYVFASLGFHHAWADMTTSIAGVEHVKPPWFYIGSVAAGMLPWAFLLPFALVLPFRKEMKEHRAVLLFAFIWLVTGFVGLSAWPSKQSHCFLPYYPAMAILIASALGTAFAHTPVRFFRWTKAVMYATFSLMTVAPFVLVVVAWQAAAPSQPIFMLLLAVPPAFFLLWLFIERRRDARRWASTATILAAIAYVYFLGIVVPAENATKGIKSFCARVQAQVPYDEPLRCFGIDPPELSFYMNRVVRRINDENELRAYLALPDVRHVIIGNEWIAQLPDNGTGLGLVPVPAVETRLAGDAHGMKLFVVKEKQP